ncbi:MAG: alpha/beta hydrolase [Clostridia bacterium]|nr:alpha/beta hydrolase [Clostridia bacterium]
MLKKSLSILLVLMCTFSVFLFTGCNKKPSMEIKDFESYTMYKNMSYGDDVRNVLDVCYPKNKTGRVDVLFYIHGGGWVAGDKEGYETALKNGAEEGYITAAMNYRYLSKDVDCQDILDDITMALSAVKKQANDLNLQPEKAMLSGGSAGGHLSLLYAYKCFDIAPIKPAFVLSYSGPTKLTDPKYFDREWLNKSTYKWFSWLTNKEIKSSTIEEYTPLLNQVSPITYVNASTVPTIICQGDADEVVPYQNAEDLHKKLDQEHVKHVFIIYHNSGHGLENDPDAAQDANDAFQDYKGKYLVK